MEFTLSAFPNPFNNMTEIRYTLPQTARVTLKVFDVTGRTVSTLVDGIVGTGELRVTWNAEGLASGVYFAQISAGGFLRTQKLLLLR